MSRTARAPDGKGSALGAARRTREYAFRPGAEAPFGAGQRATFDDQRIPLEVPVGVAGEVARERQRAGCLRAVVLGGRRAPSHRRERERADAMAHGVLRARSAISAAALRARSAASASFLRRALRVASARECAREADTRLVDQACEVTAPRWRDLA